MLVRVESEQTWKQRAAALKRREDHLRCGSLGGGMGPFGAAGFGHMNDWPLPPAPLVPRDPTSGWAVPTTQLHWNSLCLAAGRPARTVAQSWDMQGNGAGNVVTATIGNNMTSYGSPAFQTPVTGWSRVGIRLDQNTTEGFGFATGTGPNPATTSVAWFVYASFANVVGSTRTLMSASEAASTGCRIQLVQTTGLMRLRCMTTNSDGAANHATSAIRPWMLVYDRTAGTVKAYSNLEVVTGTYNSGVTSNAKGYPANSTIVGARDADFVLGAAFAGADAELFTDDDVRALFEVMTGAAMPW